MQRKIGEGRKRTNSEQLLNQFSAQIYHDLQSPLAALTFLTKSLDKGESADPLTDDHTKAHLTQIAQSLRNISNHLRDQFKEKQNPDSLPFDSLKRDEVANWKVQQIQIPLPCHFIILDDHSFAHEQWEMKFKADLTPEQDQQITRHHLNSYTEFMKWYQSHDYGSLKSVRYFFDMDLGSDAPESGLDLIDRLNLRARAVLVTNQAEDPRVQKLCAKSKAHLLSKSDIAAIPFVIISDL